MMSKHVTREQGYDNGSQIYSIEELWTVVQKCWNNVPLDMARANVRHLQIVSALYQCKGTDRFVREPGSLCCNVRRLCHTICDDNGGVEIATALNGDDQVPELKYKPPPLKDLTRMVMEHMSSLQTSEIDALYKAMDADDPWFDNVVDAWYATDAFKSVQL